MKSIHVILLVSVAFLAGSIVQGKYGYIGRTLNALGVRDWLVRHAYLPPKPNAVASIPKMESMAPVPSPCPSGRVFTMLVSGQSNAGGVALDSQNRRYERIFILHNGQCYQATDPFPGQSGASIWTVLGELILPHTDAVMIAEAFGGTTIEDFAPGGTTYAAIAKAISELRRLGLPPTVLLIQGGESDARRETPTAYFRHYLAQLVGSLEGLPVFVARASVCGGSFSSSVRAAQEDYPGPDTDRLFGDNRIDGCHFNDQGRQKAGRLWYEALLKSGILPH